MTDRNHLFREHVTATAFNLSLSKNMIAFLAMVAEEDRPDDDLKAAKNAGNWQSAKDKYVSKNGRFDPVNAGRALLSRGLIFAPYEDWGGIYCLTDAGKVVVELLVLAGLIEKIEAGDLAA